MFLLLFSSSLLEEFVTISFSSSLYVCVCVSACEWFSLFLFLYVCVALLLHTSSVLLFHAHHHLSISLSLCSDSVDFARPAGLTSFALSLSLFACLLQFVSFFVVYGCLRDFSMSIHLRAVHVSFVIDLNEMMFSRILFFYH